MKVLIVRCGEGIQDLEDLMRGLVGDAVEIVTPLDLMTMTDLHFEGSLAFVEVPLGASDWKQCATRLSKGTNTRVVLAYPGKFPDLAEMAEKMGLQGCLFFTHGAVKQLVDNVLPLLDSKKEHAAPPATSAKLVPA